MKKKRPPLQEYVRKLLYKDLSKVTTEKVLRQMRKLPWQDQEVKDYVICCMINIWNVKYNSIHCVANLLAGLVLYQEDVGIHVVDGVLEDIRLGMEVNQPKFNQRRISSAKFLGELYNYRMVESAVIFRTLYSFTSFGVNSDGSQVHWTLLSTFSGLDWCALFWIPVASTLTEVPVNENSIASLCIFSVMFGGRKVWRFGQKTIHFLLT